MSSATRKALPSDQLDDGPSSKPGLPFGELALLKELVTREQLESVLRSQGHKRGRDEPAPKIGTLLVREGILSKAEAKELLRLQRDKGPIPGYDLIEHLGSGGMGCVFRALEEATGREVAVKILPPRATQNSRFRARFLREAQVTQNLEHAHLVRSFAQGECEDHLWFAMELVPGLTLRERIKRFGAAPEPEVRATMRQLLSALAHYWAQRIVHRDIKPENIIVTPDGVAKLTDLGLCRQLDDDAHLTRVGKTLGTPLYISPELARGRSDIDIRSDLYSLAATIYHLACGVPPFEAAAQADLLRAHVEQTPPAPRQKNPRLSEGLEALLLNLLEKQPGDRLATPEAVLEALDRLDQGKAPHLPQPARKTPRPG
ncbi:MAG: serine/threonine protein kinase, partial [Planctomycetes bacterium]|nr:serine/threonine protein kinase [Planctomycetota bacterium]